MTATAGLQRPTTTQHMLDSKWAVETGVINGSTHMHTLAPTQHMLASKYK